MSSAQSPGSVLVIGGGANGMACAHVLAHAGYRVELWRRNDGQRTASTVAPAFWYPFRAGPRDRVDRWAATSLRQYRILSHSHDTGVSARTVREFVPLGTAAHSWAHVAENFVQRAWPSGLEASTSDVAIDPSLTTLPHDRGLVCSATEFSFGSFLVDTSRYLPWLQAQLRELGVVFVEREITSLKQAEGPWKAVILATGLGSRELANDPSLTGLRGQLLRVEGVHGDDILLDERDEDAMAYVVPRHDDTILGATLEARESYEVDVATTQALLLRCSRLVPSLGIARVLEARVGLRPLRPEVRVERGQDLGRSALIYNYGHGGSGVTLSWGCADEVMRLLHP